MQAKSNAQKSFHTYDIFHRKVFSNNSENVSLVVSWRENNNMAGVVVEVEVEDEVIDAEESKRRRKI